MNCWFHTWELWKDVESGKVIATRISDPQDNYVIGRYVAQERKCILCGKRQLRTVRTNI